MKINKFENLMSAVAFAEAGDHKTARKFLSKKSIAVLSGDQSDKDVLKYALNFCNRIDTMLEIFYFSNKKKFLQELKNMIKTKTDINFHIKNGDILTEVINYVKAKKDVLFVVIDKGIINKSKKINQDWTALNCKLVVVSKDNSAI
jgi:hypothetical protein